MIIACDCRKALTTKPTGVDEYLSALLPVVITQNPNDQFVLFYNTTRLKLPQWLVDLELKPNVRLVNFHIPNKLLHLLFFIFNRPLFSRWLGDVDIYWLPNVHYLPKLDKPYLITVHDLSYVVMPEVFSWSRIFWHWRVKAKSQIKNANGIMAVSNNTAHDLLKLLNLKTNQVQTIHSAVIMPPKTLVSPNPIIQSKLEVKKYFLFVGTIEPRKNVSEIIQALELDQNGDYVIALAGKIGWKHSILKKQLKHSTCQDRLIFLDYVKATDLDWLYSNCQGLIWPSLYEGFGFPPLLAKIYYKPIICANNSSLPELVGDKAWLINATNAQELAWAVKQVNQGNTTRSVQKTESKPNHDLDSWSECAKMTYNYIKQVYENNRV